MASYETLQCSSFLLTLSYGVLLSALFLCFFFFLSEPFFFWIIILLQPLCVRLWLCPRLSALFRPACLGDRNTGSFLLASVSNPSDFQSEACVAVPHLRNFCAATLHSAKDKRDQRISFFEYQKPTSFEMLTSLGTAEPRRFLRPQWSSFFQGGSLSPVVVFSYGSINQIQPPSTKSRMCTRVLGSVFCCGVSCRVK